ncbi:MAG: type I restriction endonuclease subunit R, partial [bacterium]
MKNPQLNEEMADILENESPDEDQKRKLTYLFRKDYVVLTADSRLNDIARDLVWHFNERGYQGKAMLVALDKPTAVKMYDLIQKYWPQYISELEMRIKKASEVEEQKMLERKLARVKETEICVVVSSE